MWNPDFIQTDIYRDTQDTNVDGELLGAEWDQCEGGRTGRDQEEERE